MQLQDESSTFDNGDHNHGIQKDDFLKHQDRILNKVGCFQSLFHSKLHRELFGLIVEEFAKHSIPIILR